MAKILLVEDEKMLAEMYRDKFVQVGYEVVLAFSAEEGLEMAKKEKPDLIVLDILFPRQSGVYFMEKLIKEKEIASIPVVAFSNYDDPETKKKVLKLGAKDYLIKTNYTPQEVIKKMKEYLQAEK